LIVDGGMIKNKLFLQMIADLLKIEVIVPDIEEMSSYGALLFGIQKEKKISDLKDLNKYAVNQTTIPFQENPNLQQSYRTWKEMIDKFFLSNQDKK
jgi:glycerol kinase